MGYGARFWIYALHNSYEPPPAEEAGEEEDEGDSSLVERSRRSSKASMASARVFIAQDFNNFNGLNKLTWFILHT